LPLWNTFCLVIKQANPNIDFLIQRSTLVVYMATPKTKSSNKQNNYKVGNGISPIFWYERKFRSPYALPVESQFVQISSQFTSKSAMSCPCGLSKEEVLDLDKRDRVPLVGGKCQNPFANGSDGICGKALGAHPLAQGNYICVRFHDVVHSFPCVSWWFHAVILF
jgi:hypothetical protein